MIQDKLESVIRAVSNHRKEEDRARINNKAVARYATVYGGKLKQLWLLLKPNNGRILGITEALGGKTVIHTGPNTSLKPSEGFTFSRDSKMGGFLLMNQDWPAAYTPQKGSVVEIDLLSHCQYQPDTRHSGEANDLQITIAGQNQVYLLPSLKNYLEESQRDNSEAETERAALKQRQKQLEKESLQQEELARTLAAFEAEQAAKREKKARNQRLIKAQALLRMKPILDPYQERIKRSGLYDNTTVIIDGGPGTGKTTSLIQRIKYFTDKEVLTENLPELKEDVKQEILDRSNPSWLFLSPSPLLKAYLKESMSQEGLRSNNNTVQVWGEHRSALVKLYGLIRPDKANAFLAYRKHREKPFFLREGIGLKKYTILFERHLLLAVRKLFAGVQAFKRDDFLYATEVKEVQRILEGKSANSLTELVTVLEVLKDGPGQRLAEDAKEFNETLRGMALRVQMLSTQESGRKEQLHELVRSSVATPTTEIEEENEELEEEEGAGLPLEEEELSEAAISKRLNGTIRGIIRKLASQSIGERAKLTPNQEEIASMLLGTDQLGQDDLQFLGDGLLFRKVFGRVLRGTGSILLTKLPTYYRSFRKELHKQPIAEVMSVRILEAIVEKGDNKRLHPDEQSFLIGFINNFLKDLYGKKKRVYNGLKHGYKAAYEEAAKRVIAVDEASDFTLADIYAIESLLKPNFASLTLCGDIMQRITSTGIRRWEDVNVIIDQLEENNLQISYRQSPTLLRIAKDIYERTTGTVSQYRPFMQPVDNEPGGLMLTSEDEEDKVDWIADRVMDICKSMGGTVPSIAIFLPTGGDINTFARSLRDTDVLADHDIRVMACQDGQALGDERTVRIFDIKHIKGLEFEAAFFHNIDGTLGSGYSSDMLLRNLYVGLSRATFYSAITTERELPEELAFLEEHFVEGGKW